MANTNLYIWWLDQSACEAIGEYLPKTFPTWIRDQYSSRLDRPGHGRLWAADQFGDPSVKPWPKTKLAKWLDGDFGGIVVDAEAKDALINWGAAGVITDFELKPVTQGA